MRNPRYRISKFDHETFIVYDREEKREICVCSSYEGGRDARDRAKMIADALNLVYSE